MKKANQTQDSEKPRMVNNHTNKWYSRLMWLFWIVFFLISGNLFNQSLMAFFYYIAENNAIFAFAEFLRILLAGWFIFSMYYRPNNKSIFPSSDIRNDPIETLKLSVLWGMTSATRITIIETTRIINGQNPALQMHVYHRNLIITIVSGLIVFGSHLIKRRYMSRPDQDAISVLLTSVSVKKKALTKLHRRLEPEERMELARLLFESNLFANRVVPMLIRLFVGSILVALIKEVAEELIGRL